LADGGGCRIVDGWEIQQAQARFFDDGDASANGGVRELDESEHVKSRFRHGRDARATNAKASRRFRRGSYQVRILTSRRKEWNRGGRGGSSSRRGRNRSRRGTCEHLRSGRCI